MFFKGKENNNIIFLLNKNIFSININSYKEIFLQRKSDIYYKIQLTDNFLNITWEIEKSISDFQKLYEALFILHPNLPLIPKKTPFKITSLHILDKRKYELQNFLKFCFNRKDILLNQDFVNFVKIPPQFPKSFSYSIIKENEIQFDLSVTNFLYIKNKNILIILCANTDFISNDKVNLDNILMIRNNFSGKKYSLSYAYIYMYKEENNSLIINKLWEKPFFVRAEIIIFDENKEILCIGNEEGKIHLFKTKTKGDFHQLENFGELSFHNKKITGLYLNSDNEELYSCSTDCMFFVSDLKDKVFSKSLIYNNISGFTGLKYIKKYNIFITCDEDGFISVFYFNNFHYSFLKNIQTTILDKINSMFLLENYIFIGGNNGAIRVIDVSNIEKKEIKELKSSAVFESKINCLAYNLQKDEIIIGNEQGNIVIWNNKINNFIYSLKAHTPYEVKNLWLDKNNILWSSGGDKKIKRWKIPDKWFNEDIYFYSKNFEEKKNKKDIFDFGENNDNDSSDEDELNGWSKKL